MALQCTNYWLAQFESGRTLESTKRINQCLALYTHFALHSLLFGHKQTELEDSNDQDLDLELDSDGQIKSFIFEPQYGSSSEEEEQEQEFNSHPK